MNPNATPENIAAANQAVKEETEATVLRLEEEGAARRAGKKISNVEQLTAALGAVEEVRKNLLRGTPLFRAKVVVQEVQQEKDPGDDGRVYGEVANLRAVYDGSEENKSFAAATPALNLDIRIDNPAAFGKLKKDQEIFLDFVLAAAPEPTPAKEHPFDTKKAGSGTGGPVVADSELARRKAGAPIPAAAHRVSEELGGTRPGPPAEPPLPSEEEESKGGS